MEVIEGLDLRAMTGNYRSSGEASYHPSILLGLLVHGLRERDVFPPQTEAGVRRFCCLPVYRRQPAPRPRDDRHFPIDVSLSRSKRF